MKTKNFFKKYGALLFCLLIALIVFITGSTMNHTLDARLVQIQSEQKQLENSLSMTQAAQEAQIQNRENLTGFDAQAKDRDDAKMENFFRTALTWSDADSYLEAREKTIRNYALSEDCRFISKTFPALSEEEKESFNSRNTNLSYIDQETYVTGMDEDGTDYSAIVTVQSSDRNDAVSDGEMLFTYRMDKDGNIKDINAFNIYG